MNHKEKYNLLKPDAGFGSVGHITKRILSLINFNMSVGLWAEWRNLPPCMFPINTTSQKVPGDPSITLIKYNQTDDN